MSTLDDYAENVIAPRISMISGVSQVVVQGASKYAVRVQIDPQKLHDEAIGLNEVDQALQNWNVNQPTGQLFGPTATYTIKAGGQLMNANAFKPIVVAYRRGAPVRLDQVANVIDSIENVYNGTWFYRKDEKGNPYSQRAITLQVMRQPGSNTIEVTDAVRRLLPSFQKQLPPSAELTPRQDRSRTIRAAFSDIQVTMLITLILVIGVIYLFLHNGSATLIPALALPFSILGTFAVMQVLNFSMNNLSMMALILSIGFVVDDAIVMLENIVRHMEAGMSAFEASLKGSKEIGFTILTMTTSLAAVFIPILFMTGVLGRLFREFAVTITAAILISGVVSVTLTPMLCSRFLRVVHTKRGLAGLMDRAFDALLRGYERSLRFVLRFRLAMLVVFVGGAGRHGPHVQHHPDRVHSRSGQRHDVREPACGARHVVRRHGQVDAAGRRRGDQEPVRRFVPGVGRRRIVRRGEQRPHHGGADAQGDALGHGAADLAAAARSAGALPRVPRVHRAAGVAADWRTPGQPELQPDAAGARHRGALRVGAEARSGDRRAGARGAGRLDRHGAEQPAGQPCHRPRQGGDGRLEHLADSDRAV